MLTVKELQKLKPGKWASDGATRGSGALWFRRSDDGRRTSVYFGHAHEGQKRKLPIGTYDEQGVSGLTLKQCREEFGRISKLYRSGITDLHGHFERERESAERARQAEADAARRAAEDAQRGTLRQLLNARVQYLERRGSTKTAKDEASAFRRLVPADLQDRKAAEIDVKEFAAVIGKVVADGHGRGAGKLRTALRAAYQLAVDSGTEPDAPMELQTFGVSVNPIASISARGLSKYNRVRKRALSAPEMAALLKRLDTLEPAPQRDALKLCLYLGGQRPEQLLRTKVGDIDLDAGTIVLYDHKGRRTEPRRHVVPLVKEAAALLEARLSAIGDRENVPVFSSDDRTQMYRETLSACVKSMSDAMVKAKDVREGFQLRDIRHTAETMMAKLGVSKDVRAQLLSHGLGGVQGRHYDHHDYALEKQQALKKWATHLNKLKAGEAATVTPIRGGAEMRDG